MTCNRASTSKSKVFNLKINEQQQNRQNAIINLIKSDDKSLLQLILKEWNNELADSDYNKKKFEFSAKLIAQLNQIRDRRGYNLIHIASKYGRSNMLCYLINTGLSVNQTDLNGNNAAHLVIISYLKSLKRNSNKKRRKKYKNNRIQSYVHCCELLKLILTKSPHLLTTTNNKGDRTSDLLQEVWRSASKLEREIGDEIIMDVMYSNTKSPSKIQNTEESSWFDFDYNEDINDMDQTNRWEDYFGDFPDDVYKSHLDSIPEEFKRRNLPRTKVEFSQKPRASPTLLEKERYMFHERHSAALASRLSTKRTSETSCSFKQYMEKWYELMKDDKLQISKYNQILWPPFHQDRSRSEPENYSLATDQMNALLRFVDNSSSLLRQIQIEWHPDRFLSRFGSRFKSERLKQKIMPEVIAISQLLNKATDILRERNKKTNKISV